MKKRANIPKVFIGFVIASAIIWLFINLIKVYTTQLTYSVNFVGLSQDKILKDNTVKELDLSVRATGFKLLSLNFSDRRINVSLRKLKQKNKRVYYFLINKQQAFMQRQLPSGVVLQPFEKDTIFFNVDLLTTKKVPLIEEVDITYQLGYDATDTVHIEPDSVVISGAESVIKQIEHLRLQTLQLKKVSESISQELPIVLPEIDDNIKISQKTAMLTINVAKYTEGEVHVPVAVKNFSGRKEMTIFPKTVKILFKVELKNYNKIVPKSFEVVCDYQQTKENEIDYLIPQIVSKPNFVSSIRMVPDKIDFLIRE